MTTAANGRFEDRLRRSVDAMVGRPEVRILLTPTPNLAFPLTTEVAQITLTVDEARAVLALVEAAREVVRTRGSASLADRLARLDEASPR